MKINFGNSELSEWAITSNICYRGFVDENNNSDLIALILVNKDGDVEYPGNSERTWHAQFFGVFECLKEAYNELNSPIFFSEQGDLARDYLDKFLIRMAPLFIFT